MPPDFPRPLVTVDVVIFTVRADALQVLLVRRPDGADEPFPGRWALPGGFVDVARDATLLDCALRKLREKTGAVTPYLEQLGSWGDAKRDPRGWSATHCFYALLPAPSVTLEKGDDVAPTLPASRGSLPPEGALAALGRPGGGDAAQVAWFGADAAARKRLAFDHARILAAALERLRGKVEYTSLPAFLLEEPFTLPALQQAYETVLGRPVDKSAFRKRMLDGGFLEEAGMLPAAVGRPAMGWRLRDRARPAFFPRTFLNAPAAG